MHHLIIGVRLCYIKLVVRFPPPVHVAVHRNKFLYNKNQLDALISRIYFGMKLYVSSVHHQEFIHCTLSSGVCHTGL